MKLKLKLKKKVKKGFKSLVKNFESLTGFKISKKKNEITESINKKENDKNLDNKEDFKVNDQNIVLVLNKKDFPHNIFSNNNLYEPSESFKFHTNQNELEIYKNYKPENKMTIFEKQKFIKNDEISKIQNDNEAHKFKIETHKLKFRKHKSDCEIEDKQNETSGIIKKEIDCAEDKMNKESNEYKKDQMLMKIFKSKVVPKQSPNFISKYVSSFINNFNNSEPKKMIGMESNLKLKNNANKQINTNENKEININENKRINTNENKQININKNKEINIYENKRINMNGKILEEKKTEIKSSIAENKIPTIKSESSSTKSISSSESNYKSINKFNLEKTNEKIKNIAIEESEKTSASSSLCSSSDTNSCTDYETIHPNKKNLEQNLLIKKEPFANALETKNYLVSKVVENDKFKHSPCSINNNSNNNKKIVTDDEIPVNNINRFNSTFEKNKPFDEEINNNENKPSDIPEIKTYYEENMNARGVILNFKKPATILEIIFEFITFKVCCKNFCANNCEVNPKIYDLIEYLQINCCKSPHLFRTPIKNDGYKKVLIAIEQNYDVDFREFTAVELASALKMYLREKLDGILDPDITETIIRMFVMNKTNVKEIIRKNVKLTMPRDRIILLCKILELFLTINENFNKSKCGYYDLVIIMSPYLLPISGCVKAKADDILKIVKIICDPFDLERVKKIVTKI
ncbi:hypothetical protein DMUE_3826 [Dictyocoela muelleri]|nr:hypothetical protein DMUE_3826 [Dictyocoela muelleri]